MASERNELWSVSVQGAGQVVTGAAAKFNLVFNSRSTEGPTRLSPSHSQEVLSIRNNVFLCLSSWVLGTDLKNKTRFPSTTVRFHRPIEPLGCNSFAERE